LDQPVCGQFGVVFPGGHQGSCCSNAVTKPHFTKFVN
jgi:hypothetical protein